MRILLFSGCLVLCAGCSQIKFVYNHGAFLLRQKIYSYTDFTSAQEKEIRAEIDRYFDLHRRQLLPQYAAFLRQVDTRLQHPTLADAHELRVQLMKLVTETERPLIHSAAVVLKKLSPVQINGLERSLDRQNNKFQDEWLHGDREERLRKRAQKTVSSIEEWTGGLTRFQVEKVTELNHKLPYMTQLWFENRKYHQSGVLRLLRAGADTTQLETYLREWLLEAADHRPAEQLKQFADFEEALDQFLLDVWDLMSEAQKERAHQKLRSYAQSFTELHNE